MRRPHYLALAGVNKMPYGIRAMPYLLAQRLVKALCQFRGSELWSRNSFPLGYFICGLSDLDFTLCLGEGADQEDFKRAVERYGKLKKLLPFLGEINVYRKGEIRFFSKCANPFELQRDPVLCSSVEEFKQKGQSTADRIVFAFRMLDSDYHNLSQIFSLRRGKWAYHLRQLLDERRDNVRVENLQGLWDLLDIGLFQRLERLRIRDFLPFYFETRKGGEGAIYESGKFRAEYMVLVPHHWSGYAIESGHIRDDIQLLKNFPGAYKEVMVRQLDWEIWGLNSQYPLRLGSMDLMSHFDNLRATLKELRPFDFPGLSKTCKSFNFLEEKYLGRPSTGVGLGDSISL